MGLFNQFPYTNFHELNLDWLLKMLKELNNKVENFVALNTIKYADPIQWNITTQYEANTVVVDSQSGTAYISSKAVPAGVALTNTDYWSVIFTLDIISANKNLTLRDDGSNVLATFASVAGDWLLWNGTLYKVSQAINVNEAYVEGYNLTRYTIEMFIDDVKSQIANIITDIGDLDNLTTSDKTSLVSAINELVSTAYQPITKTVQTVADLITLDCVSGDIVYTLGYYTKGDAGAASYIISSTSETGSIALDNGLYANVLNNILRPEMFGCICDGTTDDYTNFNIAVQYATNHRKPLYIYNNIAIDGTIELVNWLSIIGATDGGTIDTLGTSDLFHRTSAGNLDFCTIKNLRLRGSGSNRCFNFDNDVTQNVGSRNLDIRNLDISNFGMAFRITNVWLVLRFSDLNIQNCSNGIYWAGHDGCIENFEISGSDGGFGALMVVGSGNRFTNGEIYLNPNATYGGVSLVGSIARDNIFTNVNSNENGKYGFYIDSAANSNIITGSIVSENNTSHDAQSCGYAVFGSYNVITGCADNMGHGTEEEYALRVGGSYNDIVITSRNQNTGNILGTTGSNYVRINGTVAT